MSVPAGVSVPVTVPAVLECTCDRTGGGQSVLVAVPAGLSVYLCPYRRGSECTCDRTGAAGLFVIKKSPCWGDSRARRVPVTVPGDQECTRDRTGGLSVPVTVPGDQSVPVTVPEDQSVPVTVPGDQSVPVTVPRDQSVPVTVPADSRVYLCPARRGA